jgi:hypothetical protein
MAENQLKNDELILWKLFCEKNKVNRAFFSNIYDEKVISKIRELIHVPVWKPIG